VAGLVLHQQDAEWFRGHGELIQVSRNETAGVPKRDAADTIPTTRASLTLIESTPFCL
jgi:hypothetical protein